MPRLAQRKKVGGDTCPAIRMQPVRPSRMTTQSKAVSICAELALAAPESMK